MPVFLAGISTILGAIMFLRFGYAVGHLGLFGCVVMIVLGHLITIPTALALSEIATNRRVEGGGEYFIVSRSFGLRIGGAIGIALYLSQAVSVAFYCIAFGEALTPLSDAISSLVGMPFDPRMVSIPTLLALTFIMTFHGASMGIKVLYVVVSVLFVSLLLFFLGDPVDPADGSLSWTHTIDEPDMFFVVFAICFPGFTGMTAGVGLSGDLAQPRRAIPIGTMAATFAGLAIYLAIVWKLATHASPELLANDQLVMADIALWGPIIPIGLGAATISSAIGSLLVAPRTLQALSRDRCLPLGAGNSALARGVGDANEPRVATVATSVLALVVVVMGDVDFVAKLISMFFMVTYGALCAISFLEHFASNPSYRPRFRTRWYVSLFGAVLCLLAMFLMAPLYAVLALVAMVGLYVLAGRSEAGEQSDGLAVMLRGAMSQATRYMQIRLQRGKPKQTGRHWRPSIIIIDAEEPSTNSGALLLLAWLCEKYGFGTYVHRIEGMLDESSYTRARERRKRLVHLIRERYAGVYADTMVSPSWQSALAQCLQMPGVSGLENNTVLFSCPSATAPACYDSALDGALFASATHKNLLLLRCGDSQFGARKRLHVWLTWHDGENANLMLLLAYILLGHEDWRQAELRVFAAFPADRVRKEEDDFVHNLAEGRLPIGESNIEFLASDDGAAFRSLVEERSATADLVIMGATVERLRANGRALLEKHPALPNVLFVAAFDTVRID